jgi:phthalate 4,5-dioxygenase oxygenase subunit
MVEAARTMRDTGKAIGKGEPHIAQATISAFEGVVPKTVNWRSLGGGSESTAQEMKIAAAE